MKTLREMMDLVEAAQQPVAEGSIDQRITDKKKNNPLQGSVKQSKYGYSALVTYKTGETAWHGGAYWQTPELAMGHAKAFINGYPHLEQESAQRFIDKNRDGIVQQGVAEDRPVDQELVNRQEKYWNQVAKEKKDKEKAALKAAQSEYEKTPQGKAEKYWSTKGVAEDQIEEASPEAMSRIDKLYQK